MSTPTESPVRISLREQAYENFRQQIFSARIRPGQFVSQRELAALLEMPLGAIREMIPRLEAAGKAVIVCMLPLPRFILWPCCDNTRHISNFKDLDFERPKSSTSPALRVDARSSTFQPCFTRFEMRRSTLLAWISQ